MSKKEMTLTQAWEVKTTLPNETAANAMAKDLVESKLAACVQIAGPVRSVYHWENVVQSELEWTLAIKTLESKLDLCRARIAQLHTYKVPEILANPIHKLSDDYQQWLHDELSEASLSDDEPDTEADVDLDLIHMQQEPWHLQIQAMGSGAQKHGTVVLRGLPQHKLFTFEQWSQPNGPSPLRISFEAIADQLTPWPGMYFEMDGSFVWVSTERDPAGVARWQLDGMIYDRAGTVQYVELKGRCDRNAWTKLVSVLNPNEPIAPSEDYLQATDSAMTTVGRDLAPDLHAPLLVHLIQVSAWVLETEFRKTLS
ncbi:MAG: divalent-cation tolerance protein CutA [Planctomycetota bacterium]|nr:divalent-cation tolerance protein CutA [Planctomycetota bacterium]